MARGGSRKGAGRKPGSATTKTREIAERVMAEGLSPLEVMLDAMRYFHGVGRKAEADEGGPCKAAAEAYGAGAAVAKDAAPFVHPKLASIEHNNGDGEPFKIVVTSAQAEY